MSAKCPQSVRGADTSGPAPPHGYAEFGGRRASTPLPLRVIGVDALDLISAVSGRRGGGGLGRGGHAGRGLRGPRGRGGPTVCTGFGGAGGMSVLMRVGGQRSPRSRGQDLLMLEQETADAAGVVRPGLAGWAPLCGDCFGVCGQPTQGRRGSPRADRDRSRETASRELRWLPINDPARAYGTEDTTHPDLQASLAAARRAPSRAFGPTPCGG